MRATRAEVVTQRLRQAIRAGGYLCGERLVEQTLAARFNTSQNTIRDALRVLEAEGWVVKIARRGVHVRNFTPPEAEEVYALWAAVEGQALRWAMGRIERPHITQLRNFLSEARRYAISDEQAEASEELFHFHAQIGELSGRAQAIELLATLHNRAYLLERLRQMRRPRELTSMETMLNLYERLVDLIDRGDQKAAVALLQTLIMDDCASLLPALQD
jgi:DNA-binding GntR family transcriptional regulator